MPLPKPSKSKAVSRRIKKPKPLLSPAASHAEKPLPDKPNNPLRERRLLVICTDPDATDSSSDEEDERAPLSSRTTRKRRVHEICLPACPPPSFYQCQRDETSMGSVSSSSSSLASEERKSGSVSSSSACPALVGRKSFKIARKEVGLESLYERTDEPIVGVSASPSRSPSSSMSLSSSLRLGAGPSTENSSDSPAEEDFSQFLADFFSGQDDGSIIPVWSEDLGLLDDSMLDDGLNFDLDFDSAAWINSVQTSVQPLMSNHELLVPKPVTDPNFDDIS